MKVPSMYSNFRLAEIVEEFVHSERDRKILIRKFCDKRTIGQLAEEFQISETAVKTVLYKQGMMVFSIMEKEKPKDD